MLGCEAAQLRAIVVLILFLSYPHLWPSCWSFLHVHALRARAGEGSFLNRFRMQLRPKSNRRTQPQAPSPAETASQQQGLTLYA